VGRAALRWLLALSLLGCLSAHAASPVWAVRGAHNTVYLAGSIHMLPAEDAQLPPGFARAFADSSKLVMELDLGKFDALEAMSWMMDRGALPPGKTLRGVLGEQRYGRISSAAAALGLSMQGFELQAPWIVGIEITDAAYTHAGFDPEQGVEEQLLRRAQSEGRATAGLETFEEEMSGLVNLSAEDQLRMLDQTLDDLKDLKAEMREVLEAWRHGDTKQLATLLSEEYDSFPSLYKPLVTDRNQRWLPQVQSLLKEEHNSLVVVGALHLVGKGGLLELLQQHGYQVTQLQ
jgi:uncharacterized protein